MCSPLAAALRIGAVLLLTVAPLARASQIEKNEIRRDSFLQRDLNDYLDATIGIPHPDSTHPDEYGRTMNRMYLLRPHPSVTTLRKYFLAAAAEFEVPAPLLMVVGQVENNWTQSGPRIDLGWGIMHLVQNGSVNTLGDAAGLLGVPEQTLKDDARQNIRGAAVLLAQYAGADRANYDELVDWLPALARLSGLTSPELQELQAINYLNVLAAGVRAPTLWGEEIVIEPRGGTLQPPRRAAESIAIQSADYPPALTNWAASCNYDYANGRTHTVDTWVNHWFGTNGTYYGVIDWFKKCPCPNNPNCVTGAPCPGYRECNRGPSSAHFVIKNSNGEITQMVPTGRTAWHAGAEGYAANNPRSIGVEHEVQVSNPAMWNSAPMLEASATMARYFQDVYDFPSTQEASPGICGHNDMPGTNTACPGPLPWATWMSYFNGSSTTPAPVLTTRQVSPLSVTVNQPFTVTTTMRVDGATAEHAGISVSFPSLTLTGTSGSSYNSTQGSVTTTSATGALQVYKDNYPLHLLAEADWSNVAAGATKNFNLTVTPKQTGSFVVRIRGWVTTNGYSNAWRDPSSGTLDQQGYPVYEYTVNVTSATTRIIRLAGDLAFGDITVGGTATRTLTIYNDGNATLNVSGISYPSGFSGTWSGSIAPGGSKAVTVTFAPTSAATYGGTVTVSSDKTSGGNTIACSGRGVSSSTRIIRLVGDLSFDTVTVGQTGTRQLTMHNDGNATLTVSSITYPSGFTGDWSAGTIGAGSSRIVNVTFAPAASTTYGGTVTVNSDKTSGTNTISCSGTGTVASQAVYDAVLKAPKCAGVGSTCDSGSLLVGRAGLGPEPNAPNTIANSCSDGASGVYHADETNDRLTVSSTDGTSFAPGKAVRIEATVWAFDSSDVLDIYYTADAQNPTWLWIATFKIGSSGSQTLATIYTIPSGTALHAVRANFRYQGSPSSCTTGPYDDHDDLAFAVNNASGPQTLTVNRSGSGTVTSTPTGINCGATCAASFTYNSQVTLTASAATGWTFSGWTGACNNAATQCSVTMSQARTLSATFSSTATPEPHGFIEVTGATTQVHDLGVGPDGSVYVLYGTTDPKMLHVVKSTDGAETWQSPVDLPNSTYTNSDFQLAVDPAGVLHVVWYVSSDDQIYYTRSTDGGVSFSTPLGVRTGNDFDGYRTDNGVDPAVGSDGAGNVYVAFGAYTTNSSGTFLGYNVWVSRSANGGSSFAPEFPITAITSTQKKPRKVRATAAYLYVLFMDETNDDLYCHRRSVGASTGTTGRVNGTPGEVQYGGDLAVGLNDAILYAVFSDTTSDSEGNITFTKSTDGGLSWYGAVTVNDSTSRQQYHPMIGVDSAGRLHAAWTDGRSNGRTQAYYAYSTNDGTGFSSNVNVSAPMTDVRFTQTHLVIHNASSSVYLSATREITQVMVARLSTTPPQQQPPTAPTGLNATAGSTTRVELTWATVTDADEYQIERKAAGGSFTPIGTTSSSTYADTSAAANSAYLYRVRATNEAGPSPNSANDLATTIIFTDTTLAGRSVQSIHIMQLRTAVDALRALAGLPTATFTYPATAGTFIQANDVAELRTNTDEARSALGLPVIAYSDATVSGQTIKAVHLEQLRERFR